MAILLEIYNLRYEGTERMFWGVLQNATTQTNGNASTDGDIQFVVNGLINSYMEA